MVLRAEEPLRQDLQSLGVVWCLPVDVGLGWLLYRLAVDLVELERQT